MLWEEGVSSCLVVCYQFVSTSTIFFCRNPCGTWYGCGVGTLIVAQAFMYGGAMLWQVYG